MTRLSVVGILATLVGLCAAFYNVRIADEHEHKHYEAVCITRSGVAIETATVFLHTTEDTTKRHGRLPDGRRYQVAFQDSFVYANGGPRVVPCEWEVR